MRSEMCRNCVSLVETHRVNRLRPCVEVELPVTQPAIRHEESSTDVIGDKPQRTRRPGDRVTFLAIAESVPLMAVKLAAGFVTGAGG